MGKWRDPVGVLVWEKRKGRDPIQNLQRKEGLVEVSVIYVMMLCHPAAKSILLPKLFSGYERAEIPGITF